MHAMKTVVVLGAGYGGLRAALGIAKSGRARVILIDKKPYHAFPAQWYEVATLFNAEQKGKQIAWEDFHRFFYSAAIPIHEIVKHAGPNLEFREAAVSRVIPRRSLIELEDGSELAYDWLIVALGSQTNYFNIPHLESNSYGFKSVEEALNVRDRIDEIFLNAPKHKKITIVVGGGGFTGTELAGELVGYMEKLSRQHKHPHGGWACVVVEAGKSVLGGTSPWIQKQASARLHKLGVTVLLDSPIVDVWPNSLIIGPEKRSLPFDLLLWTAGVKGACEGDLFEDVTREKRNCLVVDETLRLAAHQNVFVIGDIAATIHPVTKMPMPMTAQKALHEGSYVERAMKRLLKNDKAILESYVPKKSSFIIPIGGKYALVETPYVHAAGFPIWVLKYVVLFKYLITILPFLKSIGVVARELRLFTKND